MASINVTAGRLAEQGLATNDGTRIGFIDSATKVAQNDTLTVTNATTILAAFIKTDADGVDDPATISGNVLTLTSVTAGPVSAMIIFK